MKEKLMQCTACGQVAAGENPENLKRVCLACCPRLKTGAADTAYIVFSSGIAAGGETLSGALQSGTGSRKRGIKQQRGAEMERGGDSRYISHRQVISKIWAVFSGWLLKL